jgi:hypothetical protein
MNKNTKKLNKKKKRTQKNHKKTKRIQKNNKKTKKTNKMNGGGRLANFGGGVVDFVKPGARASAAAGVVGDAGRSVINGILTMENPIVYAYQLIERNIFGWDTVDQERKMGKTVEGLVGDKFEKKNTDFSFMQFLKGKSFLPGGKNFVEQPEPPKLK